MPKDVEYHMPKLKRMNKLRSIDLRYFGEVDVIRSLADDTICDTADSNRTCRLRNTQVRKIRRIGQIHGGER